MARDSSNLSRRELLKLGACASLVLSTAGLTATLSGCSSSQAANDFAVLRDSDLPVLRALFPAIVGSHPALQADGTALELAVRQLDTTLDSTSPAVQRDVLDLLGMLSLPVTRGPLTGIWGSWDSASPDALQRFLERWQNSRLDMLRQGYKALCQLLLMSWYALPQSWAETGYPGPPTI
ncbi:twin-arginine translocation pathway signal protein [Halopseudomonas nanhaiensis]|uniref:twin-arginine translocation pathway signal protein n=1 Tax=Halopseudomonas nanhaiensis TaxID=2830842 RepID=UPI001CBE0B2F|nr:twin-arginine translocation pathway signal protein [Halopseudomonas nanhaiensis]UAW98278.1 twin-arginine translocation pathway signal protein [Halopseudomonas nanhaiensis]